MNTDITAALVAAFTSEGLDESQQAMVLRLGWKTLDEFATFAAMTTLEGKS